MEQCTRKVLAVLSARQLSEPDHKHVPKFLSSPPSQSCATAECQLPRLALLLRQLCVACSDHLHICVRPAHLLDASCPDLPACSPSCASSLS